jgi:ATP-dependent Clp protease ATP-binding subunit ClpC
MPTSHVPASIELTQVLDEAKDIAEQSGNTLSSGHVLLALFTVTNRAQAILEEREITEDRLLDHLIGMDGEPVDTIAVINSKTAKIAKNCDSDVIGTVHLLAGLCRVNRSQAFRALETMGVDPHGMRTKAIAQLTGRARRIYKDQSATTAADRVKPRQALEREDDANVVTVTAREPLATTEPVAKDISVARPAPEPMTPGPSLWADEQEKVSDENQEQMRESRFRLDSETFPMLARLGRNLTVLAEIGQLDPLIGREQELDQLIDVLNKRRSNNPCIVGEPGVGKTAIVEGLAQRIVSNSTEVGALGEKIIIEIQMGTLLAGTQLRGAFSERMMELKDEVASAEGRIVLFIDEIHTLVGAGAGDGPLDAANELKSALARGEFPCIGATTEKEYRKHIESDPALARRFQVVMIDEPDPDEALEVLRGLEGFYSEHHKVRYRKEALKAAVHLSSRWLHERHLPSKAIDILDQAGAHAVRMGRSFVTVEEVARVVAQQAQMPAERLMLNDQERLLGLANYLRDWVVGHDESLERVASVLQRNFAGFVTDRPMGSFLLLGPTGVGKTECAKVLADYLFGSRDAMCRVDMSEYMDTHSVSRLIGAPPGFVGHEEGGQLTEAVRGKPYQIILLDEVEKASVEVLNILLQLLDDGRLTDGRGRTVRFENTVVFMTSNLGHEEFERMHRPVGFAAASAQNDVLNQVVEAARKRFSPELWNRIDDKLVFRPLTIDDVKSIAGILLKESSARLLNERRIGYETTEAIIPFLIENGGYDPEQGARPMRRTIQKLVEGPVAEAILSGRVTEGATLKVGVHDGRIAIVS